MTNIHETIGSVCSRFKSCPRNQSSIQQSPTLPTISCVLADSEQKSETNQKPKKQGKAGRKGRMPEFPLIIGKKPYHATIYATGAGKFTVKWKQAGKWRSTTFSTLAKAQNHAQAIADKKKANQLPDVILKQHEVHIYADIKRTCERLGVSVSAAFDEYQSAKKEIPDGYTLSDAVKALKQNVTQKDISIADLCDEFIKYKEGKNINDKYLRSIKACINKLKSSIVMNISEVDAKILQDFKTNLNLAPATINHYVGIIKSFLNYAINHEYLPTDTRLVNALETEKSIDKVDNLMKPEEFIDLYTKADNRIKARYFLVAFCGLRVAEAQKWTIKSLTDNCVVVDSTIAKKGQRRTIEVSPNIVEWLRSNIDPFELLEPIPEKRYTYSNKKAADKCTRNVLRHSYISYAIAKTKDKNLVAQNAGTSVEKIASNYWELTDNKTAVEWFGLIDTIILNNKE